MWSSTHNVSWTTFFFELKGRSQKVFAILSILGFDCTVIHFFFNYIIGDSTRLLILQFSVVRQSICISIHREWNEGQGFWGKFRHLSIYNWTTLQHYKRPIKQRKREMDWYECLCVYAIIGIPIFTAKKKSHLPINMLSVNSLKLERVASLSVNSLKLERAASSKHISHLVYWTNTRSFGLELPFDLVAISESEFNIDYTMARRKSRLYWSIHEILINLRRITKPWCLFSTLFVIFSLSTLQFGAVSLLLERLIPQNGELIHGALWAYINYSGTLFGDRYKAYESERINQRTREKDSVAYAPANRFKMHRSLRFAWKSIINWNLFNVCWMTFRCIAWIQHLIWLLAFPMIRDCL